MGYSTYFQGSVSIDPPLNVQEHEFLRKFSQTRRMHCTNGPYYVDRGGFMGEGAGFGSYEPDVIDHNRPPPGQPGLWCHWTPTVDGGGLEWDDGEKFYDAPEWMKYLLEHFLKPGAIGATALPFLQANHTVNGVISAQGEDSDDRWDLVVRDNQVFVRGYTRVPGALEGI